MKRNIIILLTIVAVLTGCKNRTMNENPFLNESYNTPFEVPPFDKIKAGHYKPAYLKGMEEQKKNVQAIINNPQAPTFENTIKALEYSGELLTKVSRVFGSLNSAHTNDTLQAINKEMAPLLARHRDDINLNDSLFRRVQQVYENRDKFNLTGEEMKVL
ncbi:MAG TPA: hypothetical protein P5348_09650 [Bacteroidales bacterium]|nr:hypothetical protein [Bacteroidales bacterium]